MSKIKNKGLSFKLRHILSIKKKVYVITNWSNKLPLITEVKVYPFPRYWRPYKYTELSERYSRFIKDLAKINYEHKAGEFSDSLVQQITRLINDVDSPISLTEKRQLTALLAKDALIKGK